MHVCKLCPKIAIFEIRRIKTGEWIHVCPQHDGFVGKENLMAQGVPSKEATLINREVKKHNV